MQSEDTTSTWFFNLWPWLEANNKRIVYGATFIVIAIFAVSFYSWRQSQKETAAGEALTQAVIAGNGAAPAETYLQIATTYPGTRAGQRAQLQGAISLFAAGRYADAQTQFQKFLDAYPDNSFVAQANLGVAASLNAQEKIDLAATAYQKAANQSSDGTVVAAAKFALAQIYERQGKISDAQKLYEDVARTFPNTSISSEAGLRMVELRTKSPMDSVPAAAVPNAPFTLTH